MTWTYMNQANGNIVFRVAMGSQDSQVTKFNSWNMAEETSAVADIQHIQCHEDILGNESKHLSADNSQFATGNP